MGCLHSKGDASSCNPNKETEVPKTYSWENREKVNPADFTIENVTSGEYGRLPGTIKGQQFIIQNCQSSFIYLFDHINTITVDDCSGCTMFIGPTTGSLFLRDCQDCIVVAACGQFRIRDCHKMDIFLHCQTQPIIEASTKMRFGCFQAYYPQLKEQFDKASLSIFNNNWANIHDFTPVEGEKNWSVMSQATVDQSVKLPTSELLKSVQVSFDPSQSVVPYTRGSPNVGRDEASLVILFFNDQQHARAKEFISVLKDELPQSVIQLSREVKMEPSDAERVFQVQKYKMVVNQGPVIALLCLGFDVQQVCSKIASRMNENCEGKLKEVVYVTSDSDTNEKQIDAFFSYASMTLSL
ncbi:protein XRP2-like [Oratosquilla oratoria]|uniref:protein XRP2-like n=1 Tax=Oratosquilla oratoria TaxID=337810 RepID=UPI003F760AD2